MRLKPSQAGTNCQGPVLLGVVQAVLSHVECRGCRPGEWEGGKKHGQGIIRWSNGKCRNGASHGPLRGPASLSVVMLHRSRNCMVA